MSYDNIILETFNKYKDREVAVVEHPVNQRIARGVNRTLLRCRFAEASKPLIDEIKHKAAFFGYSTEFILPHTPRIFVPQKSLVLEPTHGGASDKNLCVRVAKDAGGAYRLNRFWVERH